MLSFIWDIIKWWHSRKERKEDKEEKRLEKEKEAKEKAEKKLEKVETSIGIKHFNDTFDILIDVLNVSDFAIPIRDVALHCITSRTPCDTIFSRSFHRTSGEVELQPRRRETFILPGQKLPDLSDLCDRLPTDMWLAVESQVGEIDRVTGELLINIFRSVTTTRETLPLTADGLHLLSKSFLQELASKHPIRVAVDDWKLWRETKNVGAIHVINRWKKGDIRYSCSIHLRNDNGIDDKIHRLRIEFRKGLDVVTADELAFKQKSLDLPALKWITLDIQHGLHDNSDYAKSDSIWFCCETVGDNVRHEWHICAIDSQPGKG